MTGQLRTLVLALMIDGISLASMSAQLVLDAHGASSVETQRQSTSWGGGLAIGAQRKPGDFAYVGMSLGGDYLREQHLGRARTSVTTDVTVAPPWSSDYFVPFVGGAVSVNWSGGQYSEWSGAHLGIASIAGVKFLFGGNSMVGGKLEGRYGYVNGGEHAIATRLGFLLGL